VLAWIFNVPAANVVSERHNGHPRLIDGSDHPLPGILPLVARNVFTLRALPAPEVCQALRGIRVTHALTFDLAMPRGASSKGARLAGDVFETQSFFVNPA
jgi:hypothetical protein